MRFGHWMVLGAAVLVAVLASAMPVAASTPAPPVNDNYLSSLELNGPGTKLNDTENLVDVRNTTSATVQANILSPCGLASCPAGPAEVTSCNGVSYGNTIWYDFYPNQNGAVEIQTSGFPNVITVYPFSLKTELPNVSQSVCQASTQFPSDQLTVNVKKGVPYTIQIGGVNGVGGGLQFTFGFFAAAPHRLSAQSTLEARSTSTGVQLVSLSVSTSRTATVTVKCGRFCRSESKTKQAVETFPHLDGTWMPAKSKLQIYVTAPHSIGAYVEYDILPGNFKKLTRCLEPGSKTPRKTCH